jgi:hypothetical protein
MIQAAYPRFFTMKSWIKALLPAFYLFCFSLSFQGCSDYTVKNPIKNLKKSIQTMNIETIVDKGPTLSQFMLKYHVLKKWGYPDEIHLLGTTPIWGAPITCWVYYAWIPDFPVNYRNVAREYRLYFQGDTLMKWEESKVSKDKAITQPWPGPIEIRNRPGNHQTEPPPPILSEEK